MENHWRCECGEDVPDDYVECWNCQSYRPGYSTPAQQVSEYDRQTRRTDQLQDVMERQNKRADEIMDKSLENEQRLSKLLERYEAIADILERKLSESNQKQNKPAHDNP